MAARGARAAGGPHLADRLSFRCYSPGPIRFEGRGFTEGMRQLGYLELAVALTAPLLQALRCRCRRVNSLFEDPGSALKGGVKVCKRLLVNEVLGFFLRSSSPI